jgi:hypothetical protein
VTNTIIPSSGEIRHGAHIDLNVHQLRAGDRVLFEPEYGRPRFDTIDLVDANVMAIDGVRYCVTAAKARFRPARGEAWEQALIATLEAAYARAPAAYERERGRLVLKARRGDGR